MKTKNDMLLDLTSHYLNTPLEITNLESVTVGNDRIVVYFRADREFGHIVFNTSTSNDIITANILINNLNSHRNNKIMLYYNGVINGITTEEMTLVYYYE